MDYKARMYDPYLNRWIQPDTTIPDASSPQDWNRYAYANGNPITYIDPSGHESIITNIVNWWTGESVGYTGSDGEKGHGPRQAISRLFGINVDGTAANLPQIMISECLQNDSVTLKGKALNDLEQDPALLKWEDSLVEDTKQNSQYEKENLTMTETNLITFGGRRTSGSVLEQSTNLLDPKNSDTLNSFLNPSTWIVRNTHVQAEVSANIHGNIDISYHLADIHDLRPEPYRSAEYNQISKSLSSIYYGLWGCNSEMSVYASWSVAR